MQTSNKELILLVDDDPGNLKRAQTILGEEFRISATTSGKMALSLLSKVTPDLILLDVNMPEMNGFETLKKIRELENGSMIPVVFLTGDNDAETETKCFEAGAMDFVGKPFVSQVLVSRVKRILENRQYQNHLEEMVASQVAEMTRMQDEVITGIANLIESRDGSTGLHVKNTQNYVQILTKALREKGMYPDILDHNYELNTVKASVLHDIGKIGISDRILNKAGKLTEEEFEVIKRHPIIGASILKNLALHQDEPIVKVAYEICRWHHERYDGGGYPDGLKGEQIPISAQIVSLADVYDALVSDRIYKKAYSHKEAVRMILAGECGAFNPLLLECLEEIQGKIKEELEVQDVPEISPVPVQCPISEISELSMPEDKK